MHSPPRAVSAKEQQDWKIPPCISNWKNAKGYTIPLDKRLAADGRGLQETAINDKYAKFAEALYVAEQQARQVTPSILPRHCSLLPLLILSHCCISYSLS
jgi:SNW domain-containing protein 1